MFPGLIKIVIKPSQADLILSSTSLSFSLMTGATDVPGPSRLTIQSSVVRQVLTYSVAVTPAAPWLSVSGSGSTPGSMSVALNSPSLSLPASANPYQTAIVVTCLAPSPCAGSAQTISVALTVTVPPAQLSVSSGLISFTSAAANPAPVSRSFGIQNAGGGIIGITSITAADGWATISGVPATLPGGPAQQVIVTSNPAGLKAGYYLTTVTVNTTAGSASVPVALLIADSLSLNLNPAGTQFALQAGGAPGSRTGSFLVRHC